MKNAGYDLTKRASGTFNRGDRHHKEADMGNEITIRRSTKTDLAEVARVAALDSRGAPSGDMLLAFENHELRAAVGIDSGETVADPFHHTADLVALLRVSADRIEQTNGLGQRLRLRHAAQAA
jgi:hypothetical protein